MTNPQYLLPGEEGHSSSIVHTHGRLQTRFLSTPRIYLPKDKDLVLGGALVRTTDLFLIDINSIEPAILPIPSFDSGRLPARHAMNRLSVVYAHVVRTDSWTQAELSCQTIDSSKKKSDFGLITQGNVLRCSLALADKLQRSKLINRLHSLVKNCRIRITKNGFIWYTADSVNSMIAIKNVLFEHENENNLERLIEFYHSSLAKLQQQDDNLNKIKQQQKQQPPPTVSKPIETVQKTEPQSIVNSNAVTRLLNQVIRSVLDKIIDEIEKNE